MKRIYLDYASTTPVDPRVKAAMEPYFSEVYGNPGALHQFGQKASAAVFKARRKIADSIGAHYREIVFTGSATESNNLALSGVIKAYWSNKSDRTNKSNKPRIIISAVEHEGILETSKELENEGVEVYRIPVSKDGFIKLENLKAALNENTVLVSVMYANNEIGIIQPVREIAEIIRQFRSHLSLPTSHFPLFHTDAAQAFQYLNCNVDELGVDFMTLSAHKIYGPKGVGALYVRNEKLISPIITGGGQEGGDRSGTENVPAIVGFAKAVELADQFRKKEFKRVEKLRNTLLVELKKIFPKLQVNGSLKNRLPNNLNIFIPGKSGEQMLVQLDLLGVSVSSGAACSARSLEPIKTLLEMGFGSQRSQNSLRMTLGRLTTPAEIARVLKVFEQI